MNERPQTASGSPCVVHVDKVWKTFSHSSQSESSSWVLHDVSLSIVEGECVGLFGPSGSGKTTLAHMIAGLLLPSRGQVKFYGKEIHRRWDGTPANAGSVQIVFQDPFSAINPRRTVREWLSRMLRLESVSEKFDLIEPIFAVLDLNRAVLDRHPGELSGGECQRVCIASALLSDAKLMILDEFSSMLDFITTEQIVNDLVTARRIKTITYLVISHDSELLSKLCDTVYLLFNGRIVAKAIRNGDQDALLRLIDKIFKEQLNAVRQP